MAVLFTGQMPFLFSYQHLYKLHRLKLYTAAKIMLTNYSNYSK